MINIENVSKSFKDNKVLQDVSFSINTGDFVAIMGPSGSGKSTLLYSISGMDSIDNGKVSFDGINICEMNEKELADFRLSKMGFVFQSPQMLKNLSVLDNIILPGLVSKKESVEEIKKRGLDLMKKMEIEEIQNRDKSQVSGGQLQRASICRAMINNPSIIFLDEPTGALNSEATDQVLKILGQLNDEGMTIMTVTHDKRVAAKAKRVIYIIDGRISASKEFTAEIGREIELDDWLKGLEKPA